MAPTLVTREQRNKSAGERLRKEDRPLLSRALVQRLLKHETRQRFTPFGKKKITWSSRATDAAHSLIEHILSQQIAERVRQGESVGVLTLRG